MILLALLGLVGVVGYFACPVRCSHCGCRHRTADAVEACDSSHS